MKEVLLLKCGELVLKGLNRKKFEDKLLANLKRRIYAVAKCEIKLQQSIIYVWIPQDADGDAVLAATRRVFGIVGICRAMVCGKSLEEMQAAAQSYLADRIAQVTRFKIETKRGDKKYPMTSIQVSQHIGGEIADTFTHLVPDMHTPELTIHFEIRAEHAFVHAGPEAGAGGMPVGINGRAAMLLSGGIDSPVAGWMMAKRGLELVAIHFFSYPYTSPRAREKVEELARILTHYTGRISLLVVPFTDVQEAIRDNCHEELFTLIMRRFMMRISQTLAAQYDCGALITGECLGQVASQTMQAMAVTQAVCQMPIFQPVVGMDKEEIVRIARKIDTFETSILPYEDCCTVFTPKHPNTRPKLAKIEQAEQTLDIARLVEQAVEKTQCIVIG